MGRNNGGTKMWCLDCLSSQPCEAIPVAKITGKSGDCNQRKYFKNHSDIHFF